MAITPNVWMMDSSSSLYGYGSGRLDYSERHRYEQIALRQQEKAMLLQMSSVGVGPNMSFMDTIAHNNDGSITRVRNDGNGTSITNYTEPKTTSPTNKLLLLTRRAK